MDNKVRSNSTLNNVKMGKYNQKIRDSKKTGWRDNTRYTPTSA